MTRRIDRHRRQRIIDATLDVILDEGVRGVSHRRVAAVAEVPTSATTYYFSSLEDLVAEAFTQVVERDLAFVRDTLRELGLERDPLRALTGLVHALIEQRTLAVLAGELWTAALRSERLERIARAWDEGWFEALAPYLDPLGARMVPALCTGIVQQAVMSKGLWAADEVETALRRGLGRPDPRS